jgi:deoxycytidylate deaminase
LVVDPRKVVSELLVGKTTRAPELVFGLVGPIGTDLTEVGHALETALKAVGYTSDVVRLSELLPDTPVPGVKALPGRDEPDYYRIHMDAGDELRKLFQSGDALAGYAIRRIRAARDELGDITIQQRRYATILHSLKHEDEVELLRATYRGRFILVGASASLEQRTATLEANLADQGTQFSTSGTSASEEVAHLLQRDEDDPTNDYGQHVRNTFAKADAFLWLTGDGEDLNRQARRVVELMFGRLFETPNRDELAMFHAQAAALRSADAGRQVGVAITNRDGDLLVTGTNEVPRPGGGQYWVGDAGDTRDFRKLRDTNKRLTNRLIADILQRLRGDGWLAAKYRRYGRERLFNEAMASATQNDPAGPLVGARVTDLLEFSRVVHAEMAAISEAAMRGIALAGSTLYTTTYPCHLCARLIIACGVERVVYIDPYMKSVVPELFGDQIEVAGPEASSGRYTDGRVNRVAFSAFTGISPTIFAQVFIASGRKPDGDRYPTWDGVTAIPQIAQYEPMSDADSLEVDAIVALQEREAEVLKSQRPRNRRRSRIPNR